MRRAALLAVVLILPVMAQDVTLSVDAGRKAAFKIPRTIYGTFLEPIGNSIYGGLWAQLLVNGFTKLVENDLALFPIARLSPGMKAHRAADQSISGEARACE